MTSVAHLELLGQGRQAEVFAWGDGTALRLFRPGMGGLIDREEAAMRAAQAAPVHVPAVFGRETVDGRQGLVIERFDGDDDFTRIGAKPWLVRQVSNRLGTMHAQLHSVEVPTGTLPDVRSWCEARIAQAEPLPDRLASFALATLRTLHDGDRLLHGDFHPGNILVGPSGAAVIDWTNATRGDPDADVARTRIMMRMGAMAPGTPWIVRKFDKLGRGYFAGAYERSYRRERPYDQVSVDRWMVPHAAARLAEDIPEEVESLLAFLEQRAGQPVK